MVDRRPRTVWAARVRKPAGTNVPTVRQRLASSPLAERTCARATPNATNGYPVVIREPLDVAAIGRLRGQEVLSVDEAAAIARCGRRAIYALIKKGRVPAVRVGPWLRITGRPFFAYLEAGDIDLVRESAS